MELAADMALTRRKGLKAVSPTNKRWNAPGRARPDDPLATWCEARLDGVCTAGAFVDAHNVDGSEARWL